MPNPSEVRNELLRDPRSDADEAARHGERALASWASDWNTCGGTPPYRVDGRRTSRLQIARSIIDALSLPIGQPRSLPLRQHAHLAVSTPHRATGGTPVRELRRVRVAPVGSDAVRAVAPWSKQRTSDR